jgi:ubiquinone/menaquinone biosynthesis C-methylase UbiE
MGATDSNLCRWATREAIEAWDGPLFDRFVQYRHIVVAGLTRYGAEAMRLHPPAAGARVLDVGCGFGDTTREPTARVGAGGSVLGVDASLRFIAAARHEALPSSTTNVRFEVADVETSAFSDQFDLAFSRFGTMFFANPVAALRNVRRSLVAGGRLVMVVWRAKMENHWLYRLPGGGIAPLALLLSRLHADGQLHQATDSHLLRVSELLQHDVIKRA